MPEVTAANDRELVLTRLIDAPPKNAYRCWTEPELLTQWFAPKPWTTPSATLDIRPGGSNRIVMRGPAGEESATSGVYLEVVPGEKLVMTDAYVRAWEPSEKPFITIIVTFEYESGQTRYTARVRHWTVADCAAHEQMGFHAGWNQATDQLAAVAATL